MGTPRISRTQFLTAVKQLVEDARSSDSNKLFDKIDQDRDGFVTFKQIDEVLMDADDDIANRESRGSCKTFSKGGAQFGCQDGSSLKTTSSAKVGIMPKTASARARERMKESKRRAARGLVREMQEKIRNMREAPEEEADYSYMSRIMHKNRMKVTGSTVSKAMDEFKHLVPSKTSLDINQFDIIMKSIGVKCAFDRHRLFRAFDF